MDWAPVGDQIVFTNWGGLYLVEANGSEFTTLVESDVLLEAPCWSLDGQYIAFTASPFFDAGNGLHSVGEIYLTQPNEPGLRRVTEQQYTGEPLEDYPLFWLP